MIMKISAGEFKHKIELQVVTNKKVNGFLEEVTETVYNGRAKIVNIIKTETNNGTGELTVDNKKFYISLYFLDFKLYSTSSNLRTYLM